jgi:triphosphoribosyl-dephospho-CoA synthase
MIVVALRAPRFAPAPPERRSRDIARTAIGSLWAELALYPKPGLVSLRDSGAHADMDASTFIASLFALSRYFDEVAAAGAARAPFEDLQARGIRAETAMLSATGGVNTHRGAIFSLGLLCAAGARAQAIGAMPTDIALRTILLDEWSTALSSAMPTRYSHGVDAMTRYGVGGARGEAQRAFPSVFEIALPALRAAIARGCGARLARLSAFFALLARIADTNVLHRAGADGLALVQRRAREFQSAGDVHARDAIPRAQAIHREFVAHRVSPGGAADLLAAAIFVDQIQHAAPG